jgi:NDP-4-keto-2,6-dideoxyhexose 3-C-methyltransferase
MQDGVREVKNCRACGTKLPTKPIFSLGDMPVVDFPATADTPAFITPLHLLRCPACELVQLQHTVDPDRMFRNFHYRSGVTESMRKALKSIVRDTWKYVRRSSGDAVCDIGSNDGTLLGFYDREMIRVGFEPARNFAECYKEKGLTLINDYFGKEHIPIVWYHRFKVITAIAMFYDLDDPSEFLKAVKLALHPDGIFIVQMNYLGSMLRDLTVDNIEQEHLTYFSANAFAKLVEQHGMTIEGIEENSVNGGSIRFYVRDGSDSCEPTEVEDFLEQEKLDWDGFRSKLSTMKDEIVQHLLVRSLEGHRLAICGASTRGLALLHYLGLGKDTFVCAGDRDPNKHGRFYGNKGIPIVSEEEAREKASVQLILPYYFQDEITAREQQFIAHGGELVVPLPKPISITNRGVEFL